jgi:Fe-S cluster biogenesis protein NfuA
MRGGGRLEKTFDMAEADSGITSDPGDCACATGTSTTNWRSWWRSGWSRTTCPKVQHSARRAASDGTSSAPHSANVVPKVYTLNPPFRQVMRDRDSPLVASNSSAVTSTTATRPPFRQAFITEQKYVNVGAQERNESPCALGTHGLRQGYLCPMTAQRPPVSVYAESTPNPVTMRFVSSRLLVQDGRLLEFRSPEEPVGVSPLAEHVFNLPFVTGVFIASNFITVTRNNSVDWDLVQLELREYIQDYLNTDGRVVYEEAPAQALADANERASTHADPKGPEDEKIIRVLEEYIRPAVESDGGHIAFKSFDEGIVTVSLRGSCSGCPSSMVTLKQGIENLLKHEVPGVREVVAEEL